MKNAPLTRKQIISAFAIAALADLIQLPFTIASTTIVLAAPLELVDFVIDFIAMVATSFLLGFHWLLLPTLIAEAIPGLDFLPTWTACVACVVKMRREGHGQPPKPIVPEADAR